MSTDQQPEITAPAVAPVPLRDTASIQDSTSVPAGGKDVLAQVFDWSKGRLGWQRDALRRIVTATSVTASDLDEIAELCKSSHGLSKSPAAVPLNEEHLAIKGAHTETVSIASLTHHSGVNALAAEQTVAFGPNLTIVYGSNAAGKSGYARILKRACRSRGVENILGNVLSSDSPLKPRATIRYREAATEMPLEWTPDTPSSKALARVSVFDTHCAPVYLRDKTDVAFRPYGLDIFDKLAGVCGEVRARLESEQEKLNKALPILPELPEGTRAQALIASLTALTNVDAVRTLATMLPDDVRQLKELREKQRDSLSSDPKQRSRELGLKAERLNLLVHHVAQVSSTLGDKSIADLQAAVDGVRVAQEALSVLQKTAFTPDLLPGTGGDVWRAMWERAEAFAQVAYPGVAFPVLKDGARCPVCQQTIATDVGARLKHFYEYVSSEAQVRVTSAGTTLRRILSEVSSVIVERSDMTLAINEVAVEDGELAEQVRNFLSESATVQVNVSSAAKDGALLPRTGVGKGPIAELRATAVELQNRAVQLESKGTVFDPKLSTELRELEARTTLSTSLPAILQEIERKKRLNAYRQCIDDTSTVPITRKSTELTKELVTDHLRSTFRSELEKLEFKHLDIEIQPAGGTKGVLFHRLVFTNAPGVPVSDVLSEGESRTLSLAAFLTELSTAPSQSAIIFDDPVSSLDHVWRERIARRLVTESKTRQVIVFTHDLLFLRLLIDETEKQGVACENQYVRRDGQAGICSPDLPWIAMPVKDRIGKLRVRWQSAEKIHRTAGQDAYEGVAREMYGLLREAWERAITEVLLNDVVERYRPSIETKRLRFLHDITHADCDAVDKEMTECSRWICGHDQAAADGTPLPDPTELKGRIDELERWVKGVRQRRG